MALFKVEHRVGINKSVDDVYAIVGDINAWPSWSPIHKAAAGSLKFGTPVALEEYYQGLGTWEIKGTLVDYAPLSHIHVDVPKRFWEGKLIRYFEFEILSDHACSFTVGAAFDGFLSKREGKRFKKYIKAGFEAMGEALKAKAEGSTNLG
jgi:hypothetical protein